MSLPPYCYRKDVRKPILKSREREMSLEACESLEKKENF
jgi:hypothetical protein